MTVWRHQCEKLLWSFELLLSNSGCNPALATVHFTCVHKFTYLNKQPRRGVPRKWCSENMVQIYRRPPITHSNLHWSHFNIPKLFNSLIKFSNTLETSLSDYNKLIWTAMKSLSFKDPTSYPHPIPPNQQQKKDLHIIENTSKGDLMWTEKRNLKKAIKIKKKLQ